MREFTFAERQALSQSYSAAPWWEQVYREAFPSMIDMRLVNGDGWAQRGGIDRVILLADGTHLKVDEKVREDNWPDILLEVWSDHGKRIPGWAHLSKHLTCDFIAYALIPTATCYLLPYQLLRRALVRHGNDWWAACDQQRNGFRFVDAHNRDGQRTWVTRSIVVPTPVLLNAIRDALTVQWQPTEAAS